MLQNQPAQLELVDTPPALVDVRVRGASSLLSHIAAGDVVVMVDLTTARPGRRIFHLTLGQVRAPYGVEVTQVAPGTVSLLFEPSVTRNVPVVPIVEGDPAPGYAVGTVSTDPPSVVVTGPESALKNLREATTEPVSVAGATRSVREIVNVAVADSSLRMKPSATAVVTVEVSPVPVDRPIKDVAGEGPRRRARSRDRQVVPSAVSLSVRGRRDLVEGLAPASLNVFVDVAGLRPGRYNLPVSVEAPRDVEVQRIEPATVRVRIR